MPLTKVTFACDDSVTVWTVKLGHILCMFLQNVHLHGATLGKTGMADVALVWLLTCNTNQKTQRPSSESADKGFFSPQLEA